MYEIIIVLINGEDETYTTCNIKKEIRKLKNKRQFIYAEDDNTGEMIIIPVRNILYWMHREIAIKG